MKRSPLERRTPLRNGAPLKRHAKQPMSPTERALARVWFEWVTRDKRCAVCGAKQGERLPGMHGLRVKIEAHHVVPKERLKQYAREHGVPAEVLLWDARNGMPICSYPCHERATKHLVPIPRAKIPASVVEFAEELGLVYVIDRIYPAQPNAMPAP